MKNQEEKHEEIVDLLRWAIAFALSTSMACWAIAFQGC